MATVRVSKRENPFVQIDKFMFNDERLSWKAKGLLGYLLSKPDDWTIRISDLVKKSTDGEKAIYSALEELERNGYIERNQIRLEAGKFGEIEYVIHERPLHQNKTIKIKKKNTQKTPYPQNGDTVENQQNQGFSPHPQKRDAVKRDAENRQHTNNDFNNNDLSNNDFKKREDDEDNISYSKNPNLSPFQAAFVQEAHERNIPSRLIEKTLTKLGQRKYHFGALSKALDITIAEYIEGRVRHFASYFVEVLEDQEDVLRTAMNQPIKVPVEIDFPMHNWLES